eukprot:NODE_465_length_2219_cov_27.117512_g430_i0.p1 GENE.NODE_465_length_2219_cov_27.117512_g430_i0~~NODE_465_length_2219_cov_27.117512_g430_i0.p1  ORF type:complete len:306 (-),score=36.69 NODE_465_length_2219_cov_27.117512_g430_i0:1192-2109(-)
MGRKTTTGAGGGCLRPQSKFEAIAARTVQHFRGTTTVQKKSKRLPQLPPVTSEFSEYGTPRSPLSSAGSNRGASSRGRLKRLVSTASQQSPQAQQKPPPDLRPITPSPRLLKEPAITKFRLVPLPSPDFEVIAPLRVQKPLPPVAFYESPQERGQRAVRESHEALQRAREAGSSPEEPNHSSSEDDDATLDEPVASERRKRATPRRVSIAPKMLAPITAELTPAIQGATKPVRRLAGTAEFVRPSRMILESQEGLKTSTLSNQPTNPFSASASSYKLSPSTSCGFARSPAWSLACPPACQLALCC